MPQQIAVITGAGSGIGRATTRQLAEYGFDLALIGHNLERLRSVQKELASYNVRIITASVDVSDWTALDNVADEIEETLGPITVWINSAGVSSTGPILSLDAATIETVTRVNYLGAVHGTRAALRVMRRRGIGKIINIGVAPRLRGLPLQSAMNGAHAALASFCECVRPEIRALSDKIDLTMVYLPWINTPRWRWGRNHSGHNLKPIGRIYEPEVAAHAIVRAVLGNQRDITVGATSILPQFLNTFFPHLRDAYYARKGLERQFAQTTPPQGTGATDMLDNLDHSIPSAYAAQGPHETIPLRSNARKPVLLTHSLRYILGSIVTLGLFYMFGYAVPLRLSRHKDDLSKGHTSQSDQK